MNPSSHDNDAGKSYRAIGIDGNTMKGSGYTEGNTYFNETNYYGERSPVPKEIKPHPHNILLSGVKQFVGRDRDIATLHQRLQESQRIAITAVTRMGGIGKTELALQYALRYREQFYPGGVCWLPSRDVDVGLAIVNFARVHLGMNPPEDLTLEQRVRYCWQNWPISGDILAILDDVIDYKKVKPFLPPDDSRFKVIITTRSQRLHQAFVRLNLEILTADEALEMLQSFIEEERIEKELETAKGLCEWLGYLPLGLELVGQYLDERKDLSLAEMRRRLDKKRLEQTALKEYTTEATAERGVKAAFELSWQELPENAREVACLLSLFAVAPIPWELVQRCFDWDEEELEDVRDRFLVKLSLLERLDAGGFLLHFLLHEFMGNKLAEFTEVERLKKQYCQVMANVNQTIPQTPNLEKIEEFSGVLPHLQTAIDDWYKWIEDEDLIWSFLGIARYYDGQGLYSQAKPYFKRCLSVVCDRLGEEHPHVATSLNNLAELYRSQGKYEEAEPLYLQALQLWQKLLGEEHPHVATSLNNLAELYRSQGKYEEAEPLYLQALQLRQKLLGEEHPHVATSLNNLAALYESQGKYEEAEPLYLQALQLWQKLLGEEHPDVATSLNNLAELYRSQGKYEEAEPLYLQALQLLQKLLGEEHPHVATSLNNLAALYRSQGKYEEAEPLYLQALQLWQKLLGEEHPDVATSLNNLAELYRSQGKYEEAEPLYLQAIGIAINRLGLEHPNSQTIIGNFVYCVQNAVAAGQRDKLSNHPITQQLLAQIDAANKIE